MNVEKLREVQEILWREGAEYMHAWTCLCHSGTDEQPDYCGTIGCVAGWAVLKEAEAMGISPDEFLQLASDPAEPGSSYYKAGMKLLDLTPVEAQRLFSTMSWPVEFRARYVNMNNVGCARAKVVADRIEHFIDTDGRE